LNFKNIKQRNNY